MNACIFHYHKLYYTIHNIKKTLSFPNKYFTKCTVSSSLLVFSYYRVNPEGLIAWRNEQKVLEIKIYVELVQNNIDRSNRIS